MHYLNEHCKIQLDGVLNEIECMKKQEYLKQHPFEIWLASDGRWKTYFPDNSKKSGRKIIARKSQENLENYIIEYYTKQERNKSQFETLYYEWLDLKRLTISKGSIERLHTSYKRFYEPEKINTMKITDISYMFLKMFVLKTIDQYNMNYKQYCNFTSVLRGVLEYAVECELIEQNPFDRFHLGRGVLRAPKIHENKEQVFSIQERKLLEHTIWEDYRNNPKNTVPLAILLDFYTGLRCGEIVSLKWNDIQDNTLHICRTEISYSPIYKDGSKGNVIYKVKDSPKTEAGNRNVLLIPKAIDVLKELHNFHQTHNFHTEYLFVDGEGKRIIRKRLDTKIRSYCKQLNIPVRSMHKIRKYYISALKLAGVPDYDIMRQAGHKELTTTLNSYCFSVLEDSEIRKAITSAL